MAPTPDHDHPTEPQQPATQASYGAHAARGMVWITAGLFVSKLASFGAQLALGWMLSKDDFAIYAIAISVSSIVASMRNGGVQRILLQRGREYHRLASPLFKTALLFNLCAAGLILAVTPWAVVFYDSPDLYSLLIVIAICAPLGTAATIMNTKLRIDLRFSTVTKISTVSAFLRHGSAVLFALLGMGPLSFVLPLVVIAVFDTVAAWSVVGIWPKGNPLTPQIFKSTLRASWWVIFGSLGIGMINQGDYLILGKLETKETLGVYFFGYQLVGTMVALIITNFGAVLTPTFTQLSDQPDRQAKAFLKATRVLSFYVFPTFVLGALIAGPIIDWLWAGKWNEAIVVVQLIALSSTLHTVAGLSRYLIQANGRWQTWAWTLIAEAAGIVLAAIIGASIGGLFAIVVCISVYRFLYGIFLGLMGCWICQIPLRRFFTATGPPLGICLACGLLPYYLFETQGYLENLWLKTGATALMYLSLVLLVYRVTMRQRFDEAATIIHKR